ncbi:MAG: hypothetical protein ACFB50_19515 [Rubrobacteraceae bacterium]
MPHDPDTSPQVDTDFTRARRKAFLRRIGSFLRNDPESNRLLSFEEVKHALGAVDQVYLGKQKVPLEKIVGSVGRHRDFDRAFLPSTVGSETRWKKIDALMHRAEDLPPVSLYKVGDVYFVQDGNHRVSVARQRRVKALAAEVTELKTRVPAGSALTAGSLLYKLEYRRLLERLPVDRVLPEVEVSFSNVADYRRLATYIEAYGFRLSQLEQRYISSEEALRHWYEHSYRPVAEMIREERVLEVFPGRTEPDLYLWIVDHREKLVLETRDETVSSKAAKEDMLRKSRRGVRK